LNEAGKSARTPLIQRRSQSTKPVLKPAFAGFS
jgi:hypothetical protein